MSSARTPVGARRCGWFDVPMAPGGRALNSLSDIALTKLDVLDALESVKVCVAYEADGARYDYPPVPPVGAPRRHAGLRGARWVARGPDLVHLVRKPPACGASDYVAFLAERTGVPIPVVGVGPGPRAVRRGAMTRHACVVGCRSARARARHRALASEDVSVTPGSAAMRAPRITPTGRDAPRRRRRPLRRRPRAAARRRPRRQLRATGRLVVGPGGDGARLEGSKAFMKDVLAAAGVPDRARTATFAKPAPRSRSSPGSPAPSS